MHRIQIRFRIRCLVSFLFLCGLSLSAAQGQQTDPAAPDATSSAAPAATIPAVPDATPSVTPAAAIPAAPEAQAGHITGTVLDTYGDVVVGATVVLDDGTAADKQSVESNDNGFFQFSGIKPGVTYHVTVQGKGFQDWTSQAIVIKPGEFFTVVGIQLKISTASDSVTVYADSAQIATEQVQVAYQQKVLGFIPNYYVVYAPSDGQSIAPLPVKLKFQIALRFESNPVAFAGAIVLGALNQAADRPDYPQGWKGYGERVGANYADGFSDILFGGAILPSVLHQDPRYYYKGTGTTTSRLVHALSYPFVCKGDNGKTQLNYSTIGGDLISASLSNLYYPRSNRGASLVFTQFAINTAERGLSTVLQEFLLRKLTPSARKTITPDNPN
jgi:Carboxypeptidase regulatory-like domain